MANNYHQILLKDTFSDCQGMFMDDTPSFFQLLEQHFDISLFIPQTFYNAFYQHLGRKRDYPLTGFLSALILQKIFSIPTDSLLILLLNLCRELRVFCGFPKYRMHLCLPVLSEALPTTLNSCFSRWSTIPSLSVNRLILLLLRFLLLILLVLSFLLQKTIPKLSMLLSASLKFITKTIRT